MITDDRLSPVSVTQIRNQNQSLAISGLVLSTEALIKLGTQTSRIEKDKRKKKIVSSHELREKPRGPSYLSFAAIAATLKKLQTLRAQRTKSYMGRSTIKALITSTAVL